MQKKNILFVAFLFFGGLVSEHLFAQTCAPDEVLISKGCACAYKNKYACQSRCVGSNQVSKFLQQGWYVGACSSDCCPVIKSANKKSDLAGRSDNKKRQPKMEIKK